MSIFDRDVRFAAGPIIAPGGAKELSNLYANVIGDLRPTALHDCYAMHDTGTTRNRMYLRHMFATQYVHFCCCFPC